MNFSYTYNVENGLLIISWSLPFQKKMSFAVKNEIAFLYLDQIVFSYQH